MSPIGLSFRKQIAYLSKCDNASPATLSMYYL